jgi:hypothetical protein
MKFEKKLVALVNKETPIGIAMNAIAHATLGLGNKQDAKDLRLDDYKDKDGNLYPNISDMPFIILRGKSSEIRKAVRKSKEDVNIQYGAFTETMTGVSHIEQKEKTNAATEEDLIFYAAVLFGDYDKLSQITKRFSLYQ